MAVITRWLATYMQIANFVLYDLHLHYIRSRCSLSCLKSLLNQVTYICQLKETPPLASSRNILLT